WRKLPRSSRFAATALAAVESRWWRRAEPFLLQKGTYLQIGLDGGDQAQSKMRVLPVAEGAAAALRSIVGRFPAWVGPQRTQPTEVIHVQMLLLPPQRHDVGRRRLRLPDLIAPLRFLRSPSVPLIVFPDLFEKGAGHTKLTPNGSGEQAVERVLFVDGQVL